MKDLENKKQLRKYKTLATGLFVLMACLFVCSTILQKTNDSHWVGYVRAFSEAAMVGALADWFAVTALFNYPMGIKIPHTNLIQNSKDKIGDNLGNFVVENFLAPQNIRPYILKLKVSSLLGEWLSKKNNQDKLIAESAQLLLNILGKLDSKSTVPFISKKMKEMVMELEVHKIIGNGLEYVIDKREHQKLITHLSKNIKEYILEHEEVVKERVKKESFILIPKFVDDTIAHKITTGFSSYFEDIETNEEHPLREEITSKLRQFAEEVKTETKWKNQFKVFQEDFLTEERLHSYAQDIWNSTQSTLINLSSG